MMAEEGTESAATPDTHYLDELLKDIASDGETGQASFIPHSYPTWSTGTSEDPYQLGFLGQGWGNFGFQGATVPTSNAQLGSYADYIASLSQADSNSDQGSENSYHGFYTPKADGLASNHVDSVATDGHRMYQDALNQWNNYSATYHPFGTSHVLDRANAKDVPTSSASKPSYSDVAKNKPVTSTTATTSKKDTNPKPVGTKAESVIFAKQPQYKKSAKTRSLFHPARVRSLSMEKIEVEPDSKYGLDNFEEMTTPQVKEKKKVSLSNPPGSRKGSSSSVSSSASGIEEILLSKPPPSGIPESQAKSQFTAPKPNSTDTVKTGHKPKEKSDHKDEESSMATNGPTEKPFFDPRRIFARKDTKASASSSKHAIPNNQQGGKNEKSGNMLNNGKPRSGFSPNSGVGKATSTYINNDLRDKSDSFKQTNADANPKQCASGARENASAGGKSQHFTPFPEEGADFVSQNEGGGSCRSSASHHKRTSNSHSHSKKAEPATPHSRKTRKHKQEPNVIGEWLQRGWQWTRWLSTELACLIMTLVCLFAKLVYLAILWICHNSLKAVLKLWTWIKLRVGKYVPFGAKRKDDHYDWSNPSSQSRYRTHGLEENIPLPTTGEEAMKRLLAGKGKDPYSILGVKSDASDDDIKKYYRRQAVLVHPDKNQQPGAEEAFKVLGHAFELIGEPEKRKLYDARKRETSESEAAMKEFADLLTKLHEKMQEAANMMRCENCGKKHHRVPVDRAWYSARQCDRCNTRHSAKEGDVWAESSYLGFLWHYYACMDGEIYDITDWVRCQKNCFKHMQANAHHVIYRIATNSNRQQHQQHNQGHSREADLEDFINRMFNPAMHTNSNDTHQNRSTWSNSNPANKKKRKKKKH